MDRVSFLKIEDLYVSIGGKEVLKGINLSIEKGEIHVLMGPNACGKTTLALTIVGYPTYQVTKGKILLDGQDLSPKDISERAKLGIGIAYQTPPEIRGVKLRDIIRLAGKKEPWDPLKEPEEAFATKFLEKVGLDSEEFLRRDVNLGFSGGERKRAELAQLFAMGPRLMILDEPDSGVDIDSLKLIGRELGQMASELGCSVLLITHHRHILQYLKPDVAHIMYDGEVVISTHPDEIISQIESRGYEQYVKELKR